MARLCIGIRHHFLLEDVAMRCDQRAVVRCDPSSGMRSPFERSRQTEHAACYRNNLQIARHAAPILASKNSGGGVWKTSTGAAERTARDAYARMAMEAENPVLPSKNCPIATVESSRMSSKCGRLPDRQRRCTGKTPFLLRISMYSSLSGGAKELVEVSPLGIATAGIFAWRYCRQPRSNDNLSQPVVAATGSGDRIMKKKRIFACAMTALLLATTSWADDKEKDEDRLKNAGTVLTEILNLPDDIPQDLLDKADCVVVFPSVLKAAFVVGGSYGRGAMTCRRGENFNGPWGAPSMMALEGGSVGFQIGGQATDFVLLVMNDRGANGILSSQVKLGADASVAAGPVGRDASAETDVSMRAEILSYSRARGLFAGISLEGSTIRPDNDANKRIYGEKISAKDIVIAHETRVPPAAEGLISTLNGKTPKHKSS